MPSEQPIEITLQAILVDGTPVNTVTFHYRDALECAAAWARGIAAITEHERPRRSIPTRNRRRKPKTQPQEGGPTS